MRAWRRVILCCLTALAVPVQAVAHDAARACHGGSGAATVGDHRAGMPAAALTGHLAHAGLPASAGADHAHAGHSAHAGGSDHGATDVAPAAPDAVPGSATDRAPDGVGHAGAGCAWCAACGAVAALPMGDVMRLPATMGGQVWAAAPEVRIERAHRRGPERPPRAAAA